MKAGVYDRVRLLVDIPAEFSDRVLSRGSEGAVVERFEHPREAYAVDFPVADDRVAGGRTFENVMLTPEQFEVVACYREPRSNNVG